ncbi:MAG: hypothetical protein ABL994_11440, partial [Verrucomicrobiales bacterium]
MNSNSPSVPGPGSLYWNDFLFGFCLKVCGFGIVVAAGFWWLGQPMPNAQPMAGKSFEALMSGKVPPIALAVAGLALLVAAWRYLRVRKIFTEGEIILGTVEELKTETWQSSANVDQSHSSKTTTRRSHYVTIRYTIRGTERTKRWKLFHSGDSYGLKKGGQAELMVLDESSNKPLIRAVYLTQFPRRAWWRFL